MENKDIVLIFLVISVLYLLYCNNLKEKFTSSSTGVTTTPTTTVNQDENMIRYKVDKYLAERQNIPITESIKNLGIIAKKLQDGQFLKFPGDFVIEGNLKVMGDISSAVSVGTIIMWTLDTPPYPNTIEQSYFEISSKPQTFSNSIYWAPCDGNIYNNLKTPDLRNKFPLGQGDWNVGLNNQTGGNVPIRDHRHNMWHKHEMPFGGDDGNGQSDRPGSHGLTNDGPGSYVRLTKEGAHDGYGLMTGQTNDVNVVTRNVAPPYRMDYYNKDTVPNASVVQYWIRIR